MHLAFSCHCNMDCHHCSIPRSKGGRHSLQAYCTVFYTRSLPKCIHGADSVSEDMNEYSAKILKYIQTTWSIKEIILLTLRRLALTPALALKSYEAHMKQQKASPNILVLPEDTTAFWLGNPAAERLIIYFPGGGYSLPALPNHFSHVEALFTDIKQHGNSIGVLFLAYELTPKARWPRQLQQAVIVLRYAIETLGKRPSDIILQGDSAGAHLALALLSHLAHPHPQKIVPRFSVDEPLRGAMLLSPWVDFRTDHASSRENADRDVITAQTLNSWAGIFLGQTVEDGYTCPTKAPAGWWRDLPVSRIFVGAGGDEVLLDPIKQTAEKMKVRRFPHASCLSRLSNNL